MCAAIQFEELFTLSHFFPAGGVYKLNGLNINGIAHYIVSITYICSPNNFRH